jgi:hypothetical protein
LEVWTDRGRENERKYERRERIGEEKLEDISEGSFENNMWKR